MADVTALVVCAEVLRFAKDDDGWVQRGDGAKTQGKRADRMPALPLKTQGSCGHGAQQCCART